MKRYASATQERNTGLHEIEILESLNHKNVVRLFEHFINPDGSLRRRPGICNPRRPAAAPATRRDCD